MTIRKSSVCAALAGTLLVGGCCDCPPPKISCIDFEDQAVGGQFNVGDSFTASGVTIDVVAVGVHNNRAEITDGQYTPASGNDLRPLNVGVAFNLPGTAYDLTLNFADLGGNSQLLINGDAVSDPLIRRVVDFDGQTIGGVLVGVTAAQQGNNWFGNVALTGSISSLTIVGQELWIDDVCYKQ